ncbi:hypothetical protein EV697_1075 [Bisgaardia hudsonensis]|uniref:Uncharacterized protein n=1 Tax=Bisgaardia hudsonensis TaxID=109472 RepID=A0A4R2MX34_9PAST|nr:hypothetical protein [Bisgaardia hudsonensis]TCP11454.1 hypothetical protein EV697_1075 [Bisgaardia hudsonensis]
MININYLIKAFERLYCSCHKGDIIDELCFSNKNAKEFLPIAQAYLSGSLDGSIPENIFSEIDKELITIRENKFILDSEFSFFIQKKKEVAIQFLVRSEERESNPLVASQNEEKIKKLIKHKGLSLLILFDFSEQLSYKQVKTIINEYRNIPSLGRGNHNKSAFNIAYFYINEENKLASEKANIRVYPKNRITNSNLESVMEKNNKLAINKPKNISRKVYFGNAQEYKDGFCSEYYECQIKLDNQKLFIEYQYADDPCYYQLSGEEIEPNTYYLKSNDKFGTTATVKIDFDEDNFGLLDEIIGEIVFKGENIEWFIDNIAFETLLKIAENYIKSTKNDSPSQLCR